jgi:hypothetical protein
MNENHTLEVINDIKIDEFESETKNDNNNNVNENNENREHWSKKLDFLMSIIGFSVDLAGIWRLLVHTNFLFLNYFKIK